ncbi:MAG: WG repeat-containing protein [Bacteroidales bacterium]|nr:WG repeat-containing protein [Bacteroidales bacterium]
MNSNEILDKYFSNAKNESINFPIDKIHALIQIPISVKSAPSVGAKGIVNSVWVKLIVVTSFVGVVGLVVSYLSNSNKDKTSSIASSVQATMSTDNHQEQNNNILAIANEENIPEDKIEALNVNVDNKSSNEHSSKFVHKKKIANEELSVKTRTEKTEKVRVASVAEPNNTQEIIPAKDSVSRSYKYSYTDLYRKKHQKNVASIGHRYAVKIGNFTIGEESYFKESENNKRYQKISLFIYNSGEWARVKYRNRWGYADIEGREVVAPIYNKLYLFGGYKSEWAMVELDGKYGFIDTSGQVIVSPTFDKIYYFGEYKGDWAMVKKAGLVGFINEQGQVVVSPIYDKVEHFDINRIGWMTVVKDKLYGFIDSTGAEVVKPQFDKIYFFGAYIDNYAMVKKDKKYGFINNEGELVIACKYDKIFYPEIDHEGWIKVIKDKQEMYIDFLGNPIIK